MKSVISLIFLMLLPAVAVSDARIENEKISLNIVSFITKQGVDFRLDSDSSGEGTALDLENDLGLDDNETVFRIDGYYWFNRNHRFDFSYFDLTRSASRSIDKDIEFGDETFNLNTTVSTQFDNTITKLAYSYFLHPLEKLDLGALIGLYVLDINASIGATGTNQVEATNVTAPLPVIGFRAEYALTPVIKLKGSFEYFSINMNDDLDGRLADTLLAAEYQFFKYGGIGIAYNRLDFDVSIVDSPFSQDYNWGYSGYLIYVNLHY